jgi:plastocyanin
MTNISKWIVAILITLGLGSTAMGQIASDNASNYPPEGWTDGSNGGMGFGPWTIDVNQDGSTYYAGAFIGDPTAANVTAFGSNAFGLYANPGSSEASVSASRSFDAALEVGETFSLQWAVNWDTDTPNRKGFRIFSGGASGTQLVEVSMNGFPGPIEINKGSGFEATGIAYGSGPMTWKVQLVSATEILVTSTARDGSTPVVYSTNITVAAAPDAFSIFTGAMTRNNNDDDQRQPYYNNFEILGAPSLAFTPDSASPTSTGDIVFTLTREVGSVGDLIVLDSSNTDAVTVDANVSFGSEESSVTFTGTVVSLISGSATITASNATSGVSATFTVNIPEPGLTITGPATVILGTTNTYTVTRTGFVTNAIDLSSSDSGIVFIPASVEITEGNSVTFDSVAGASGAANLTASDNVATSAQFAVIVYELPETPEGVYDDATFYPDGWRNGMNRGNGFGAWIFEDVGGGHLISDATVNSATNAASLNTDGNAFALLGFEGGTQAASRSFLNPLGVGDVFTFSMSFQWDGNNRGFDILAGSVPAFNLNISDNGYEWTGGGTHPPTEWPQLRQFGVLIDVSITVTESGFDVELSSEQAALSVTNSVELSSAITGFKFYNSEAGDGGRLHFNKLAVELSTTPLLSLSGPATVLDVATPIYTLTRNSATLVGDEVTVSSSDPSVATAPETVTFAEGALSVSFRLNTLSAGVTTLTASNVDVGAAPLAVTVEAGPEGIYDEAAYYFGQWETGDNNGKGFSPWVFNHDQGSEGFAGVFIGNPADAGISGMDSSSFGFFANPIGSSANAEVTRGMPVLDVGDSFSFVWGLNFDSDDENSSRGFNLFSGADQVLNINMANSSTITIDGDPMLTEYGSAAITVTITHETAGNLRVTSTGRDGSEEFTSGLIPVSGPPNGFSFYFNATADQNQRQMYLNSFVIEEGEGAEPEGPAISAITLIAGELSFSIPNGWNLAAVEGADLVLVDGDFVWEELVEGGDYTYDEAEQTVSLLTDSDGKVIRVLLSEDL